MDFVFTLSNVHPVYNSLNHVLNLISKSAGCILIDTPVITGPPNILIRTKNTYLQKLNIRFSKNSIFVLNSPSMYFDTWEARIKSIPSIIVEEYLPNNSLKDIFMRSLLFSFKNYPFVSLTKRTHNFLTNYGFHSFLIPPAEKKRKGSKKRDIILYVGRLTDSKNSLFFLELAKELREENFVMVGRGPLLEQVKEKAKNMGNVKIVDFVEDREVLFRDYYGRAKVLVHPVLQDPIGFVVVEALSTSTPVLASVNAGASDFLPIKWIMKDFLVKNWVNAIRNINDVSVKEAEGIFEAENLNIDSAYFETIAKSLNTFMGDKSWLKSTK
ncbi:MAG: glycosyltransferase family 4 protein [Candidatus Micrarchaeota archaeon]|nr:glycosyltransferase family 4 protein [Candidatus Micrarchaeota archaeon]